MLNYLSYQFELKVLFYKISLLRSVGCILYEVITYERLFDPNSKDRNANLTKIDGSKLKPTIEK